MLVEGGVQRKMVKSRPSLLKHDSLKSQMQASERLYLYSYYNNELVRFRDAPVLGGQTNLPAYTQYYLFDFL